MSEWKGMASAPKDRVVIILYWHNERPWQSENGYCLAFWSDPFIGDTLPEDAGWYAREFDGNKVNELYEPSLWAPIPALPKSIFIGTLCREIVYPDGSKNIIDEVKIPVIDNGIDMIGKANGS